MALLRGLSGRLLVLTVTVVMLVEVAIFVPSVSRFRMDYLQDRVTRGYIGALSAFAAPRGQVPEGLTDRIFENAEILNVVLKADGRRTMLMGRDAMPMVSETFYLDEMSAFKKIEDAIRCLLDTDEKRVIRVIGSPPHSPEADVEITLEAAPLRDALRAYGARILQLSLIISICTAAMVFLVMRLIVVAPLQRIADNLRGFQENPDDPDAVLVPRGRSGELAEAERAVAAMEEEVQRSLRERRRLATLGEALAKISHDLRNMLASLQLTVDRLERSSDPVVGRVLPKLMGSLDRAIGLCQRTLTYGRAEEAPPAPRPVALAALAGEVCDGLGLGVATKPVRAEIAIDGEMEVMADPDHLYRVLANLLRNAAEAISASGEDGTIRVSAERRGADDRIYVRDTGPGLPPMARENLFKAFQGAVRKGGTGLGLAIAHELVAAHRGRLEMLESGDEGTVFAITLPATSASALSS